MPSVSERPEAPTAIQTHLAASFVSFELSRSIWLITSLSPGSGEKMSKHSVRAGDVAALLARFSELKRKASERSLDALRSLREFCVTQSCSVMLRGASCNGRHAVSG